MAVVVGVEGVGVRVHDLAQVLLEHGARQGGGARVHSQVRAGGVVHDDGGQRLQRRGRRRVTICTRTGVTGSGSPRGAAIWLTPGAGDGDDGVGLDEARVRVDAGDAAAGRYDTLDCAAGDELRAEVSGPVGEGVGGGEGVGMAGVGLVGG